MTIKKRTTQDGQTRYRVRVRYLAANGEEVEYHATCRTEREAKQKELELLNKKSARLGNRGRQKLEEYLAEWIADCRAQNLSPTTVRGYEENAARYITPIIGHVALRDLKGDHVQAVVTAAANRPHYRTGEPISPTTVFRIRAVLSAALTHAVELGIIPRNPAKGAARVKRPKKRLSALSSADIAAVLKSCAAASDQLGMAALLAGTCGLCRAELVALTWERVDLERKVLHVEENVIELKGGELKRKAPKSDYRLRTVPLPEFVVTALKEYRRRQIERVHGGNVLDNGLGGCIKPQRLSDDFHKAAKAAGVKVTLHGMRHQFASIVAASGADFKRLQTLMGHSESRTTFEFYVHLRPDDYRESAALMDEQLGDLMQAAK